MQRWTTKHGQIVMELAGLMLSKQVGDRFPVVEELANRYRVGRGTVQTALRSLQAEGCVRLQSKGHLGTFVTAMDRRQLWSVSGRADAFMLLPLLITHSHIGLASGVHHQMRKAGIPFSVAYMRGGSERIEALVNRRVDLVLTSRNAAVSSEFWPSLEILSDLQTPATIGNHVLVFSKPGHTAIADGMTVAIDPKSADHVLLTKSECRDRDVKLVEMAYTLVLDAVASGTVDAAVWALDASIPQRDELQYVPLSAASKRLLGEREASAVIVIRKEDSVVRGVLTDVFDPAEIRVRQARVLSGQEIPEI